MQGSRGWGSRRREVLRAAIGVVAGTSLSSTVQAGDTVENTTSFSSPTTVEEPGTYELTADIDTSRGDAIEVRASDVTIEGNGHRIQGAGSGAGILVGGPVEAVSLQNVTIAGFERGVSIWEATDTELQDCMLASNTRYGVTGTLADGISIERCTLVGNASHAIGSEINPGGVTIHQSTIHTNVGHATFLIDSPVTAIDTDIVGNGGGIVALPRGSHIENCRISDNEAFGIRVYENMAELHEPVTIEQCTVRRTDGPGIELYRAPAEIRGNQIADNDRGIVFYGGAFAPESSDSTVMITENDFGSHADAALVSELEDDLQAPCNWWGHQSGPVHPDSPESNPSGVSVDGSVAFVPWAIGPHRIDTTARCVGGEPPQFDLRLTAAPDSVAVGATAAFEYTVENRGGLSDEQSITFSVDETEISRHEGVELAPSAASIDMFTHEFTTEGTATVYIASDDVEVTHDVSVVDESENDGADDQSAIADRIGLSPLLAAAGVGGAAAIRLWQQRRQQ